MNPPGPGMCSPKLANTGTLDLWRDGLLCAYEFIPAPSKKIKVGGEFNSQGPIQGRFDAEISLKQSALLDNPRVDSNRSQKSVGSSPSSSPKSAPGSSGTEIQGFVARESLKKDEEEALRSSSYSGRLDHQPSGRKGHSQWIPIGWQRLTELFQAIQVRSLAFYHTRSSDECLFSWQRFKAFLYDEVFVCSVENCIYV